MKRSQNRIPILNLRRSVWGRMGAVGRKTRRAQDVVNCLVGPAPVLSRAVGIASPNDVPNPFVIAPDFGSFGRAPMPDARNGSKPARIRIPEQQYPRRAEFFAPPRPHLSFAPNIGRRSSAMQPPIPSTRFSRVRLPPCASAIWRLRTRPIPEPLDLVVKNGTKRFVGFAIPLP